MLRHLRAAIGMGLLRVVLAACGYDYELSITNETSEAYYVRVAAGGAGSEGKYFVAHIAPGASGHTTLVWRGGRDVPIELLDVSCSLVGIFESDDGMTYHVPGVDGLESRITPYLTSDPAGTGIEPTNACVGTVDM